MNPVHYTDAILMTEQKKREALRGTSVFFKMICTVLLRLAYGTVFLHLPNGRVLQFSGSKELDTIGIIHIKNFSFARRTVLNSDIGFFESYARGEWDTPHLADCLYIFAKNADHIQSVFHAHPLLSWIERTRHHLRKNTKIGSRRNIMAHYDLGNEFYEKWLDQGMTYSAAYFKKTTQDLKTAQDQKYEVLAKTMLIKEQDKVLEIGSGWGGFAEFAASHIGANVTGITISPEQYDYACKRIFNAGLNEKVQFQLCDYRDLSGKFDKVASIEMYEAVGKEYWDDYFNKIHDSLEHGGIAGLQMITIADRHYEDYERSPDFIQKYVFPGGMLASPSIMRERMKKAGLREISSLQFGQDYAKTLRDWHKRFLATWDEIKPLGFNNRFKKTWQFYLAYCEAGFRAATTDVYQVCANKL